MSSHDEINALMRIAQETERVLLIFPNTHKDIARRGHLKTRKGPHDS